MPMANNPAAIWSGVVARAVAADDAPIPMKKTAIIPSRLHRSASQPAGIVKTAKATKPGVA